MSGKKEPIMGKPRKPHELRESYPQHQPQESDCPHCGKSEGTWFDRSYCTDGEGNMLEHEEFPTRCNACGKNVEAPKEYYEPKPQEPSTSGWQDVYKVQTKAIEDLEAKIEQQQKVIDELNAKYLRLAKVYSKKAKSRRYLQEQVAELEAKLKEAQSDE